MLCNIHKNLWQSHLTLSHCVCFLCHSVWMSQINGFCRKWANERAEWKKQKVYCELFTPSNKNCTNLFNRLLLASACRKEMMMKIGIKLDFIEILQTHNFDNYFYFKWIFFSLPISHVCEKSAIAWFYCVNFFWSLRKLCSHA